MQEKETLRCVACRYRALSSLMSRTASSTSGCESFSRGLLTESGRSVSRAKCRFGLAVGQEADFEIVDQLAHLLLIQQQ